MSIRSGSVRRALPVAGIAMALMLVTAAPAALADLSRGKLQLRLDRQATPALSDVYWDEGTLAPGINPQLIQQNNPCNYASLETLLTFRAFTTNNNGTSYSPASLGAKFDAIGANALNGNGTGCSSLDVKGSTKEALVIALVNDDPADPLYDLNVERWVLELELKGSSARSRIEIFKSDGSLANTYEVRGGAAADGAGRSPSDDASSNPLIDCFARADVAPDAADTCIVSIRELGDSARITSLAGSVSLEGGKSTDGFTELYLTEADGTLFCGDIVTIDAEGTDGSRASCRRLENLVNCEAACVAVPYQFSFELDETQNIRTFEFLVDEGTQCPAYQCSFDWAPEPIPAPRVDTAAELEQAMAVYPAGPELIKLAATSIQFDPADELYLLQPCLGDPVYHGEFDITLASPASTFVAGETITVSAGTMVKGTARVLSFVVDNGVATLVYEPDSNFVVAAGDSVVGPSGSGTSSSDTRDSTLLSLLDGTTYGLNGAGARAGYEFPDFSGTLDNVNGIEYGCSLQRTISVPDEDRYEVDDDAYIQGDITFSRGGQL